MDKKVTNIKYKQMDKDPEIKKVTNEMERFFFGEKGVGLMAALGMNPGKIQKHLDEEFDKELDRILAENQDYIFRESRIRNADHMQEWINGKEKIDQDELMQEMSSNLKKCEIEVIQELMEGRDPR